jgi:hypothetical protein
VFAAHPVVVRIGNADFVRSIQRVNPDGSLSFFRHRPGHRVPHGARTSQPSSTRR